MSDEERRKAFQLGFWMAAFLYAENMPSRMISARERGAWNITHPKDYESVFLGPTEPQPQEKPQ